MTDSPRPSDTLLVERFVDKFVGPSSAAQFDSLPASDQAALGRFAFMLSQTTRRERDIETFRQWAEEGDREAIAILIKIGIEDGMIGFAHNWDALSNCTKCGLGHVGWESKLAELTCPVPDAAHG
jgi:hypothetical protein